MDYFIFNRGDRLCSLIAGEVAAAHMGLSDLSSPSSLSTLHPFGQLPPQPFSRRCFCELMGPGKVTQCGSLMMVPLSYDSVCK